MAMALKQRGRQGEEKKRTRRREGGRLCLEQQDWKDDRKNMRSSIRKKDQNCAPSAKLSDTHEQVVMFFERNQ
eukprot:747293-Hanusia_phi.AAC.3